MKFSVFCNLHPGGFRGTSTFRTSWFASNPGKGGAWLEESEAGSRFQQLPPPPMKIGNDHTGGAASVLIHSLILRLSVW